MKPINPHGQSFAPYLSNLAKPWTAWARGCAFWLLL